MFHVTFNVNNYYLSAKPDRSNENSLRLHLNGLSL